MKLSPRPLALAFVFALVAGIAVPRVARGEDEAVAKARTEIVAAAAKHDMTALAAALDAAQSLVGPSATFPDLGAWSDWLGTLPADVLRLRDVLVRRGWAYVTAKRGKDAVGPLRAALEQRAKDGVVRAYLGEATRQAGDVEGALREFKEAIVTGATDAFVVPSLTKIVYDAKREGPTPEGDALPSYAVLSREALSIREMPDVRVAVVQWLAYDADQAEASKRATALRVEALRAAWPLFGARATPLEGVSYPRLAYDAAGWAKKLGPSRPADVPDRFDFLSACVRSMADSGADVPEIPEAFAFLADEALSKGRYLLASRMARRRLDISDSPTARRVLLALPPDVGD